MTAAPYQRETLSDLLTESAEQPRTMPHKTLVIARATTGAAEPKTVVNQVKNPSTNTLSGDVEVLAVSDSTTPQCPCSARLRAAASEM